VSVRQSQLRPLQVAALAAVPNGAFIILYGLITQPTLTLLHIPMNQLVAQAVIQGLLVGICSGLFYSHAIARLGAEKTATIGSMTPIVSTLLAIIFLQEALEFMPALGLCLTAVGVFFASRAQTN
jgi:drug/metabolite transporter (DMT)-like permease